MHPVLKPESLLDLMAQVCILHEMTMAQVENQQLRRATMQDYRSFPLYLSQEVWDSLADRRISPLSRVDRLVRYLVNNLGMRHPSEPSMAVMAALVGQQDNLTIPQLLTLLQTVKSVLKTTVTRAGHAGIPLPAGRYLEALPNQVAELPSDVAQAMAPGGFAAPPATVDLNVVWQTARTIPLRNTHRDVQLQRQLENQQNMLAVQGLPDPRLAGLQMAQTVAAFAVALGGQTAGRQPDALPNLQMFGQAAEPAKPKPVAGVRALMDRAEASTVPATQVSAESKPDQVEGASRDASAATTDTSVAAAAGAEPQMAQLALEDVPSKDTLDASKGTDAGSAAGDQPMGDLQGMPASVQESVRRLANAHYGKDLPAEAAPGEPGKTAKRRGRPPGQAMKRPAAKQSVENDEKDLPSAASCMKRPASRLSAKPAAAAHVGKAAKQILRKKPAADKKCQIVTEKQRHKERPNGCATCRHTPGCCPSCWRKRGFTLA